ncbi:hypothetical protein AAFF_G00111040 [Aldrovandia affinis]|uniref:Uncharacterized protein n=1 Tax=Aldrovandia affinis TaxID=143900 RepID=A0AAD7WB47_9TELE|nr:hypothetical protein AAFF_G00111040 [Aldrovandia affinis]
MRLDSGRFTKMKRGGPGEGAENLACGIKRSVRFQCPSLLFRADTQPRVSVSGSLSIGEERARGPRGSD